MPELPNAFRRIPKATYVPLTLDTQGNGNTASNNVASDTPSGAIVKFGYVRQLALQPGEVAQTLNALQTSQPQQSQQLQNAPLNAQSSVATLLQAFEGTPMTSVLPSPQQFATIPAATLSAFGNALVAVRKQAVAAQANTSQGSTSQGGQATTGQANVSPTTMTTRALIIPTAPGLAEHQLNTAATATKNFEANAAATRVGMLNLERMEMTPAGLERGELIATIPLAPKEKTSVVQKEWSVTSQEFTSIVTDSLENYSEVGVTENTELAQSTTTQATRNNQFNATGSVSGGFGQFVTASASTGFESQDQNSKSATASRKDAVSVTRTASSRVKQSHKTTISTTTTTGTSEKSTRTLRNPSSKDPMRIDYFSLMRKWHVGLYRYGLRLTYDIVIPEPGAAMRKIFAQLAELQDKVSQVFTFSLAYSDITVDNWESLSEQFGAQLPPPPQVLGPQTTNAIVTGLPAPSDDDRDWHIFALPFDVQEGYWVTDLTVTATVETGNSGSYTDHYFQVANTPYYHHGVDTDYILDFTKGNYTPAAYRDAPTPAIGPIDFLVHTTGSQSITFLFREASPATVGVTIETEPTPTAMQQWQSSVWNACYNAAQTNYYALQQMWNAQIQALQDQINNVDTLTLRREENDEIMKNVLRWLLGEGFDYMPDAVVDLFKKNLQTSPDLPDPLTYGVAFTGNDTTLSPSDWSTVFQYEQMVRFINEAIEWENVVYFLYSYFWDVPQSWDFIRSIRHPDLTRQGFLRAGSARVVLTVRQGYEEAWVRFAEGGAVDAIYDGPYLTIAQEIADYDSTNYPGIPPANPTVSTSSSDDDADAAAADAAEKGVLIAEWYEYTPSSGTDIAVTSNLATIA